MMRPQRLKKNLRVIVLKVGAVCLAVSGAGCDFSFLNGSQARDIHEVMEQRCAKTQGFWRQARFSCICKSGYLFDPDSGCVPVVLTAGRQSDRNHEQQSVNSVTVSVMGLDTERIGRELLWRQLQGRAVSRRDDVLNVFAFRDMKAGVYQLGLGQLSRYPFARAPLQHFSLPRENGYCVNDDDFFGACCGAIQRDVDAVGALMATSAIEHLCKSLRHGWGVLDDDKMAATRRLASFSDEGNECAYSCAVSTTALFSGFACRTSVTMQHMVPIARSVSVWGPEGSAAIIYLSPGLELQAMEWRQVATDNAANQIVSYYGVADGNLQSLDRASRVVENAQCREDMEAARTRPTQSRDSQVKAMVLEDDLRCSGAYLAECYDGSSAQWVDGRFSEADRSDRDEGPAALLVEGESLTGDEPDHAADMAEIIIGTEHVARFAVLSKHVLMFHGPDAAADHWTRSLASYRPRVVNISQVFARIVPHCAAAFAPIFERFPHILFVVGAGNSGQRNGVNLCPGELAASYPNVITVAGYDTSGALAWMSNHGSNVAMVAAPAYADVFRGDAAAPPKAIFGTSIAAAHVSHWALETLKARPNAAPAELIAELMASCGADGLDVACGGRVP